MYIFQSSLCQTANPASSASALRHKLYCQTLLLHLYVVMEVPLHCNHRGCTYIAALSPPLLQSIPWTRGVLSNAVIFSTNSLSTGFGSLTCPQVGNLTGNYIKHYLMPQVIQHLFKIINLLEFKAIKLFKCNI